MPFGRRCSNAPSCEKIAAFEWFSTARTVQCALIALRRFRPAPRCGGQRRPWSTASRRRCNDGIAAAENGSATVRDQGPLSFPTQAVTSSCGRLRGSVFGGGLNELRKAARRSNAEALAPRPLTNATIGDGTATLAPMSSGRRRPSTQHHRVDRASGHRLMEQ